MSTEIREQYARWVGWANDLRIPLQVYLAGAIMLVLGLLLVLLLGAFVPTARMFVMPGAILLILGFSMEAYVLVRAFIDTLLGKLVLSMVASLGITSALMLASQIVNIATGQDPSLFPYTVAFIAPLTALYFIYLSFLLMAGSWLLVGPFAMALLTALPPHLIASPFFPAKVDQLGPLFLARILAVICLITLVTSSWGKVSEPYDRGLANFARFIAHNFDSYPNDSCKQMAAERIKRVDADNAVVSMKSTHGLVFVQRQCTVAVDP